MPEIIKVGHLFNFFLKCARASRPHVPYSMNMDESTYMFFLELALQNLSMAIRSLQKYEIVKYLPEVGWRASKTYYQVFFRIIFEF